MALSYTASIPGITVTDLDVEPCRRRKIRCILADGDSRERCVTCIRLKKTCAFHPPERQHSYTGRFQTSDKARPVVDTSAGKSSFLAGQNSGWAFDRGEQLNSSPISTSVVSPSSTNSWFRPWSVLPNGLVCAISGFENGWTLPFGFHQNLADGYELWNPLDNLSYGPALRRQDDFSDRHSMMNLVVPTEGCAQFPSGDAAAYLPSQHKTSASLSLWTMPFGQTYPPTFQTELPSSSSTGGQRGPQEPLQFEKTPSKTIGREDWISQGPPMVYVQATREKTKDSSQNASRLPLKLDGDLYKRRS